MPKEYYATVDVDGNLQDFSIESDSFGSAFNIAEKIVRSLDPDAVSVQVLCLSVVE